MPGNTENGAAVAAMRRLISDHDLDEAGFLLVVADVLRSSSQQRKQGGRITLAQWTPTEADWNGIARFYAQTGQWSHQYGPDPESPACQCPPEILARWKIKRVAS